MAKNEATDSCWLTGPIRTYQQVADEMRRRGDATITRDSVGYYERRALAKIRKALEGR